MKIWPAIVAVALAAAISACGGSQSSIPQAQTDQSQQAPQNFVQSAQIGALTAPPPTRLRSSWGRIGLGQIFDGSISASQATADAGRYDFVWGSSKPGSWRAGNSALFASLYYILTDDNISVSGHNLSWWKSNHPDWILYACDSSGHPSQEIAYDPGVGFADVPLDIHNPSVVNYQLRQSAFPYMAAHNFNALAIDQGVLSNIMVGGNPKLGQSVIPGYFGCGIWSNGSFIKRYTSKTDPQYATDVLNWLKTARSIATSDPTYGPKKYVLAINHPGGNTANSNEQQLIANVNVVIDEVGFVDYGKYPQLPNLFWSTMNYMRYAQAHGTAVLLIDKFYQSSALTAKQQEWGIGTYLMGNEQGAELFMTALNYGSEQYYSKEALVTGAPCEEAAARDSLNPQIYTRRFTNGMVVVNSGSLTRPSEIAHLPTNHVYQDVFGRVVTNPLIVNSADAYVMTTTNGCV